MLHDGVLHVQCISRCSHARPHAQLLFGSSSGVEGRCEERGRRLRCCARGLEGPNVKQLRLSDSCYEPAPRVTTPLAACALTTRAVHLSLALGLGLYDACGCARIHLRNNCRTRESVAELVLRAAAHPLALCSRLAIISCTRVPASEQVAKTCPNAAPQPLHARRVWAPVAAALPAPARRLGATCPSSRSLMHFASDCRGE